MTSAVLVPFRGGDPHRDRAWAYVRALWERIGAVVEGHDEGEPFSKAVAVNDAAQKAGPWDVAIIADADTIIPRHQVIAAVEMVRRRRTMAWPFDRFHRLTDAGTDAALAGKPIANCQLLATASYAPGGVVVVHRALWNRIGGFDERFRGWGGEDNAFISALRTYGGPTPRIRGPAYHLWHPHAETRYTGPAYAANLALSKRYARALGRPLEMAALLAER